MTLASIVSQDTPWQCPIYGKKCSGCGKQKKICVKVVCKSMWWQHKDWHEGKMIHDAGQEDDLHVSFYVVRVKYINLDSVKSLIFTKLESSMSQIQTCKVYRIGIGADSNLMPLKIFKSLLPKVDIRAVTCHKKQCRGFKNVQHLKHDRVGIYLHSQIVTEVNVVKCRIFVVPGNSPVLLRMLDIEVLGILKITCQVTNSQQAGRKFNSEVTLPTVAL